MTQIHSCKNLGCVKVLSIDKTAKTKQHSALAMKPKCSNFIKIQQCGTKNDFLVFKFSPFAEAGVFLKLFLNYVQK